MENPPTLTTQSSSTGVTITNIDIPFGRLIVIMLKTMLASIPAVLIMYAALAVIFLVVLLILSALGLAIGGLDIEGLKLPTEMPVPTEAPAPSKGE